MNLGDEHPVSLGELVRLLLDVAGGGSFVLVPFPPERKRIDIGDFYADIRASGACSAGRRRWRLREGLAQTVEFYRRHKEHYL